MNGRSSNRCLHLIVRGGTGAWYFFLLQISQMQEQNWADLDWTGTGSNWGFFSPSLSRSLALCLSLSLPHADEMQGYQLPKGSTIMTVSARLQSGCNLSSEACDMNSPLSPTVSKIIRDAGEFANLHLLTL